MQFEEVNSGTDVNLYSVFLKSNDTIFICGGQNDKGVLLSSYNGGTSFDLLYESFDRVIYDVNFITSLTGFAGSGYSEIYKTYDGGHTWEKLWVNVPAFPLSYRQPLRKIFTLNDSVFYFCGGGEFNKGVIIKAIDRETKWTVHVFDFELRDIYFYDEQHGIACGYGIILQTNDYGNSWQAVNSPDEFYTSIATGNQNKTWFSGYNGGLYFVENNSYSLQESRSANEAFKSRSHINKIKISGEKIIGCGVDGFFCVSNDFGNSWIKEKSFNENHVKSFVLTSPNSGIAAGDDGKIFRFAF